MNQENGMTVAQEPTSITAEQLKTNMLLEHIAQQEARHADTLATLKVQHRIEMQSAEQRIVELENALVQPKQYEDPAEEESS